MGPTQTVAPGPNQAVELIHALRDEPGSGSVSCDWVSLSWAAAGEQDSKAVVVQVAESAACYPALAVGVKMRALMGFGFRWCGGVR